MLPDLLRPGLRVVFIGTAAGAASARAGAYYAGPGNQFCLRLAEAAPRTALRRPPERT